MSTSRHHHVIDAVVFISVLFAAVFADATAPPSPPSSTEPIIVSDASPSRPKRPKIYYTPPVTKEMIHPVSTRGVPVTRAVEFLNAHNKIRAEYNVPPLQWNASLAEEAMKYTKSHAEDCEAVHTNGTHGENIFWSGRADVFTAAKVVESWAEEKSFFDNSTNNCIGDEVCGHFTQLVWLDTKTVGCSMITCFNGGMVTMCFYYPTGNYKNKSPFKSHKHN